MTVTAQVLLARASALPLEAYREQHVSRCVERALQREEVADPAALAAFLRRDAGARGRFRRSVAVSVSGLFRDPHQFDFLAGHVLPDLVESGRRIAVWSAGCADGSELYSVGLQLAARGALDRTRLLGSDVLEENLRVARRGTYPSFDVPPALRTRTRWEVRDLVRDGAPAGRWQLVLCRNVAIYLDRGARDALHARLAGALGRGGTLLLGRSERIGDPAAAGLERAGPNAYRRVG